MSETRTPTPRTDAFAQDPFAMLDGETFADALAKEWADFARQLERELAEMTWRAGLGELEAAQQRIAALEAALREVRGLIDQANLPFDHPVFNACKQALALIDKAVPR